MKLKCAIVDDEPLALGLLESYVTKTPFLELTGKYSSAVQAMKELPDKQADLIFLDIQMPELNGLEFSKMVPPQTRIIFTTAFEQYALDGYKVNALDYLLKPISYNDFLQAANKAVQWFELLKQPQYKPMDVAKQVVRLFVVSLPPLLLIDKNHIHKFFDEFEVYVENNKPDLFDSIRESKILSDENKQWLETHAEQFTASFLENHHLNG